MSKPTSKRAKFVGWVKRGTQYSGSRLQVFIDLAERANESGICWVSNATICEDTRCSERSVQYSTAELARDGWIAIDRQGGPHGVNLYRLDLGKLETAFAAAHSRRKLQYATRSLPEKPAPTCANPVENTRKPVENLKKTGGNTENTTARGCNPCAKGVQLFAPKPPRTPQATASTKACYYGAAAFANNRAPPAPP